MNISFVYIYISNESESTSQIYWDDFKVTHSYHTKTQEDDYYPFGMRHTKRYTDTPENRHLFNSGSEFNAKLGVYETPFRQYDPVLGRFNGIDAMASNFYSMSPYQFGSNNPAMVNDPTGLYPSWYEPGSVQAFAQAANEGGMSGLSGVNSRGGWGDMGDAFWDGWGEKGGKENKKSDKAKARQTKRHERRGGIKIVYKEGVEGSNRTKRKVAYYDFDKGAAVDKDGNIVSRVGFLDDTVSALNYLKPYDDKQVINTIATSNRKTVIRQREFDKSTKRLVNWNSRLGLEVLDSEGNPTGGLQSPALGLYHELSHVYVKRYTKFTFFGDVFMQPYTETGGTPHESKVIKEYEAPMAISLGESVREFWSGGDRITIGPTSVISIMFLELFRYR